MDTKRVIKLILISLSLLVILASVLLFYPFKNKTMVFDSKKWKEDISECSFFSPGIRKHMIADLQQLLSEQRFNRPMLEELLGEALFFQDENSWSYYAGTSTIDCLSFDVLFDDNGFIVDTKLVQH